MWSLVGHRPALQFLERSLETERLAHSYLLIGPAHVGKMALALQLAQAVNCTAPDRPCQVCPQCVRIAAGRHTDVQVIALGEESGTVKEIRIDQVRELQQAAILKPFEGRCRVFIVDGAERLSQEAANALLKTLEEPPPQVLLLLLVTDEEGLLPTLRSRCQRLELHPLRAEGLVLALEERGASPDQARELAMRSQGCPGIALRALQDPSWLEAQDQELEGLLDILGSSLHQRFALAAELANRFASDREGVQTHLHLWLEWWRDLLLVREGAVPHLVHPQLQQSLEALARELDTAAIAAALRLIQETLDFLDQNANPRLALEHLLLGLPGRAISPEGANLV